MTEIYDKVTEKVKTFIEDSEASVFGFCDLGKINNLPFPKLTTGISLGISLNPKIVLSLKNGPDKSYVSEWESVNKRLHYLSESICQFLREEGYNADFIPASKTINDPDNLFAEFPHKTAATNAGLGWIGKCALLITKEYGPALRLITVFTNAPLSCGIPVTKSYCGDCEECKLACPAGAVSGKEWSPEIFRDEFLDSHRCFEYSRTRGESAGFNHGICGICVASCRWTNKYLKREGLL
ncbi:epoxyqueuosine reductase [Methanomicrobium antiquum]|uniref:Epoxyqueuosine reductase n=1 Tax=Methanomicrobium antiquum TaxID=487686 RepID=A0AAF0JMX5_9EURY|nr:epoxyqueuosine reductase [Methanomicrobium antiquum]WFN37015.1 epoxyqueuosine reductase [Methanomicrobium antiquum]